MKLKNVESGHKLGDKLKLGAVGLIMREQPSDMLRVLLYRPDMFGRPLSEWIDVLLRGASDWTAGERELLAAMVSQTNECRFCVDVHSAMAGRLLGQDVVDAALADWRTAPLREELKLTVGFVQKLTRSPGDVTDEDVAPLRAAGLTEDAILTAIHISAQFSVLNRIADALDFRVPSAAALGRMGSILLKHGYAV